MRKKQEEKMARTKKNQPYAKEGQELKISIIKLGLNQAEFAKYSGVSHDMIRDYTCGKILPNVRAVKLIKTALAKKKRTCGIKKC